MKIVDNSVLDDSLELLDDLIESRENLGVRIEEGWQLTERRDKQYLLTSKAYKTPVRIDAVVKTDSREIRLKYGKAYIIFGWDNDPHQLRVHEPVHGRGEQHGLHGSGTIEKDKWMHITWIIEPDGMRILLNEEERYSALGNFAKVSGQAGIGPAWGSTITVKSFKAAGETREIRKVVPKLRYYQYDIDLIAVPYEQHDEIVEWYSQTLGMTERIDWSRGPVMFTTSLRAVDKFSFTFESGDQTITHYHVDWDKPSGISFSLKVHDLQSARQYLSDRGVPFGEIYSGPGRNLRIDFFDPAGTRLTATGPLKKSNPPKVPFIGWDPCVIKVSDLKKSVDWYNRTLGLRRLSKHSSDSYACMQGYGMFVEELGQVCWLAQDSSVADTNHKMNVDSTSRQYYYVEKQFFNEVYEKLKSTNPNVSEITNVMSAFHLYDPDGNRLNFFSY